MTWPFPKLQVGDRVIVRRGSTRAPHYGSGVIVEAEIDTVLVGVDGKDTKPVALYLVEFDSHYKYGTTWWTEGVLTREVPMLGYTMAAPRGTH